jgi:Flp pilus assembly secretin CpaC
MVPTRQGRSRGFGRRQAALALAIITLASAGGARADSIEVPVDQAKVLRISRPASTVVIGNPAIADATITGQQILIITGRSFGTTNLIVLDDRGQAIADEVLTVTPSDEALVTVYKRAERETYSCTPSCERVLNIGDSPSIFDSVQSQISDHSTLAQGQ